ncbi:MAG: PEP-CTERM sorting domain-containing protein [Patescibacteria group bacterium]|nr:PEP-CTERM sorting domain-containing protein [Patescibacteria group bacterium]
MRRNAVSFAVCVLLSVAMRPLASAGLIAADGFLVGGSGYATANLSGQNPTVAGFSGAWSGNTGTISAVNVGLEYPGQESSGGAARFHYGSNLGDSPRYLSRNLAAYDDTQSTYYFSGLMSFDETFSMAAGSFARMGFVNSADDSGDTSGAQWGFKGNGAGVDAFVRIRDYSGGAAMNEYTIAQNIASGTHQFVVKVEPDVSGTTDAFSIWFDPVSLSSEAAAGIPTWSQNSLVWVPGNASYLVRMLVLKTFSAGAGAAVGFDEARMGTTWASVTPEPGTWLLLAMAVTCGLLVRRR